MCIESSLWPNFVSLWTWIPTTLQCFLSMNTTLQNDFVDKRPLHQVMFYNYSSLSHPIVLLSYSCHCDPCWCAPSSPTLVFPFLQLHDISMILRTQLALIPTWQERCILAIHNNIISNHITQVNIEGKGEFESAQCLIWPLTYQHRGRYWWEDVVVIVWYCQNSCAHVVALGALEDLLIRHKILYPICCCEV